MTTKAHQLNDRYDLEQSQVLLTGTQALVRLMLSQRLRDKVAGHRTAGLVTGYRGSPLGAVDQQMQRASSHCAAADVQFQYGLNEDLAATALWGAQQVNLRGEGRVEGVFGLWYGKGPGVDRSGDALRHANLAGTAPLGGVVMALGDDHTGESSTTLHQSDWAAMDAYIPVLAPAGVQDVIDFGLYGYALSRYAGLWVGLKCVKDTIETTAVVQADPLAARFEQPQIDRGSEGCHIRLTDTPHAQEARLHQVKLPALAAFSRANPLDQRLFGRAGARIGCIAAGKNWLDLAHALDLLGINEDEANRLGLTAYKLGMTWPIAADRLRDWAEGLDLIIVVEEKRKIIESQLKDLLFAQGGRLRIIGARDEQGVPMFPVEGALEPPQIAQKIGAVLRREGRWTEALAARLDRLDRAKAGDNVPDLAARTPYFCAGCPHNSSTVVPQGDRAYAGIGCHYMAQWMDRQTLGYTQMGGEGANWIGEAPFSARKHVFQNLGDGTYNHSGVLAIRAAIAAEVTITYKILFNDAVAMTGGQSNDGDVTPARIAAEVRAMGVAHVAVVHDEKEPQDPQDYPDGTRIAPRADLMAVQRDLAQVPGVSVLIYVQTCAAEKRRRRKRGVMDDPDRRLFIHPDVCEGCGDCGVQSNCVGIVPLDTPLGRKRAIDQSACNKDYSCLNGFCPSFLSVEGARPKARPSASPDVAPMDLPQPQLPTIERSHNIVLTGVGGTGVVTLGAVLSMAAHLDGKAAGMMEMAGLAQKVGAVHIHCRIAHSPADLSAIRVATGECDALIGGDLVVSAGAKTLDLLRPETAGAVVNSHETQVGAFTQNRDYQLPGAGLRDALTARLGTRARLFEATELARQHMGDTIYANMVLLGAAWQQGLIPLSHEALMQAITLNNTAVQGNQRAFEIGRWAMADSTGAAVEPAPAQPDDPQAIREGHLAAYQSARLARRYRRFVARFDHPDLRAAVAEGYHKLLSYKDEYEVARMLLTSETHLRAQFDGDLRLQYHLAPPVFGTGGPDGRPKKRAFGPWLRPVLRGLAAAKVLRGSLLDPFGYAAERRAERALITQYEADLTGLPADLSGATLQAAIDLARLPLDIRGFGPVKAQAIELAAQSRHLLLNQIYGVPSGLQTAAE